MKKFIFSAILVFISLFSFSQNEYPRIEVDSSGKKIVVMTIEQAQKIDNNFELLLLLKKSTADCDSVESAYVKVVDNQNKQIALMNIDITQLKSQLSDKDAQISNLQQRLENANKNVLLCDDQKTKKDEEIGLLKKEVRRQKAQKVVGFVVGTLALIGGLFLAIHH